MKWIEEVLAVISPELRRSLVERDCGSDACIDGIINFTSNNYLSLARHPHVVESAAVALREDGAGAGSSRLISGTSPRIASLEERLASWKRTPRALVTSSGYAAAIGAITSLVDDGDAIVLERGAHASLVAGSRLSRARISVFHRSDPESLRSALRRTKARRSLVVLDGVHSMDGDIAPLPDLLPIAREYGAMLLVDDAHATGVIGEGGRGTLAHFDIPHDDAIIQMGTLSKALGSQGGFIAASAEVVELMVQRAGSFIYTTGLNPAAVGAAHGAMDVIEREPDRMIRLMANARMIDPKSETPIISIVMGNPADALEASRELLERGALVLPIRVPTVPRGTDRLRISVQVDHRIGVEGADHSAEKGYLVFIRNCAAKQVPDPSQRENSL